jgi:UDP-2,3-diacylglucosamine pyrophosphatase LpxH
MSHTTQRAQGYVVSDLHIFGCASLYQRKLPELYESVSQHTTVVLNGDTFDFKRSHYRSSSETTKHALAWLSDLLSRVPQTTLHYIVGNHDCQNALVEGISQLAAANPNLRLYQSHLRLGTNFFLHGDILDITHASDDLSLLRQRYATIEPSITSKLFAHLVSYSGLNKVEYLRHTKQALTARIMSYMREHHPQELNGIRALYFGHTHVPFTGFVSDGIAFHNTGSLIRGLQWLPLRFSL